jgi:hypothetical protein
MDYSPIEIRFLNVAGVEGAEKDDVIRIKRNKEEYLWNYKQNGNKSKRESVFLADGAAVLKNLKTTLNLLAWDDDPFQSMQIAAPGYPSTLIKMKNVLNAWSDIAEFLTMVFENWPLNTNPDHIRQFDDDLANPALDEEDEEDEEDEDEEDDRTDPDMPALAAEGYDIRATPDPHHRSTSWNDSLTNNPLYNANTTQNNIECECDGPCGGWGGCWVEAGEERQRREPITIRRIVNTPNGPRTHIRFV